MRMYFSRSTAAHRASWRTGTQCFVLNALVAVFAPTTASMAAELPPQAVACQACHGRDGFSVAADIPHLAGQRPAYLAAQLKAFRDGTRKNELMAAVAAQLKDSDITALANHWGGLPPAAGAAAVTAAPHAASVSQMRMPADFPKGFVEYRREIDTDAGIVAISYANATAWQAVRAGQPLPEGSAIIVANHSAQVDGAGKRLTDAKGELLPGKPMSYSGMQTEEGWGTAVPELLRNGNWNYGVFNAAGESRIGQQHARCLACHKPQAAASYVFTLPLLREKAKL